MKSDRPGRKAIQQNVDYFYQEYSSFWNKRQMQNLLDLMEQPLELVKYILGQQAGFRIQQSLWNEQLRKKPKKTADEAQMRIVQERNEKYEPLRKHYEQNILQLQPKTERLAQTAKLSTQAQWLNTNSQGEVVTLRACRDDMIKQIQKYKSIVQELQTRNFKTLGLKNSQLEQKSKQIINLQQSLQNSKQQLQSLKEDNHKISQENLQLKAQAQSLNIKMLGLISEIKQQNLRIEQQNLKVEQQIVKIEELSLRIQMQNQKMQSQISTIQTQSFKIQQQLSKIQLLQQKIRHRQQQNRRLISEISHNLRNEEKELFLQQQNQRLLLQNEAIKQQNLFHMFQGRILHNCAQEKRFLQKEIEQYMNATIKYTRIIYAYDPKNPINYHQYIDQNPNICLIIKLKNGRLIAGFSVSPVSSKAIANQGGMLFSLTEKKSFKLVQGKRSVTYDSFFLIFGNSQLRLKFGESKFFTNFGIANSFYHSNGEKYTVLSGLQSARQQVFEDYEVLEACFEQKKRVEIK